MDPQGKPLGVYLRHQSSTAVRGTIQDNARCEPAALKLHSLVVASS